MWYKLGRNCTHQSCSVLVAVVDSIESHWNLSLHNDCKSPSASTFCLRCCIIPSQLVIRMLYFSFAPTPCSNDDYHQIKGLHRNIAQTQTPAFAATLPYMQCNHRPVQNKCNGAYHSDNKLKRSNPFCVPTLKAKLL